MSDNIADNDTEINQSRCDDFSTLGRPERIRMRHCLGCKYMGVVAAYGCCDYYLTTGNRRPCKFGQKCSVKVLRRGFVLPKNYSEWCDEWDRKIAERREREERERLERESDTSAVFTAADNAERRDLESKPKQTTKKPVFEYKIDSLRIRKAPCGAGTRGRKLSWDVDYAFSLYCAGFYITDIEDIMGIKQSTLNAYIEHHGWRDEQDRAKVFHRADIQSERKRYLAWKKRRDADLSRPAKGRK